MALSFAEFIAGFSLPVVICLIVGIVFMVIEMFTPGFGVAGTVGIIALILAVVLRADSVAAALWMLIVVLTIVGVMLLIFLRSATKGAVSRSAIILKDRLDKEDGYMTTEDLEYFIGKEGETITVLRPAGMADFDGVKLDVVSEGEFIGSHERVRVMRVEGRRILVRQVTAEKAKDIPV